MFSKYFFVCTNVKEILLHAKNYYDESGNKRKRAKTEIRISRLICVLVFAK